MSTNWFSQIGGRRQMTADIAHELRNPLMVMTGYIEALRDGVLRPTPERFDMMYEEAQHLQRLVADLRTLSLADAGELGLAKQTTDPEALLSRVAEAYGPAAEKAGVNLAVAPAAAGAAALPAVNVDVERMVQVLANLVTDALRHTPAGGAVALGSSTSRPTASPSLSATAAKALRPMCCHASLTASTTPTTPARTATNPAWALPSSNPSSPTTAAPSPSQAA